MRHSRKMFAVAPIVAATLIGGALPASAQITVFDPSNYAQNVLTAARALEQINNQIRSLENEAEVLSRMDQNLTPLNATLSPNLQRTLGQIQIQIRTGDGIALSLGGTQANYGQMYPASASATLTSDQALQNAINRWNEAYQALQRSALTEGAIGDSVTTDTGLLATAMTNSRTAVGALQATQAGNELQGLGVKQSLALQSLIAAHARAETADHARDLATEDEARQRFKSFLGDGPAYAASQ
ncbi:MAG: P-type conjugative transfer protein TrbJ [Proteobacteria bacterium]|nr:P-type conjugative transfer protein TrbJ [Pseudomonadota bacterium]